jgi:hypothetical protein
LVRLVRTHLFLGVVGQVLGDERRHEGALFIGIKEIGVIGDEIDPRDEVVDERVETAAGWLQADGRSGRLGHDENLSGRRVPVKWREPLDLLTQVDG